MHRNPSRPLSPHLTIWKWGPHMAVSILNRVTGIGLAIIGAGLFTWWLFAASSGAEAYATFDRADLGGVAAYPVGPPAFRDGYRRGL